MRFPRRSGILLHPTSLPGPYGIGDLGPSAYGFVNWLHDAGQRLWQVLPLGPTGYGDSPYQSFSAFAGNPLLISPDHLRETGLLEEADFADAPNFPTDHVDFGSVQPWKRALLRAAFDRFKSGDQSQLDSWAAENSAWLEDYALFIAIKEHLGNGPWIEWPDDLRRRDEAALNQYRTDLADEIAFQKFLQFVFFQQWSALREYAHSKDVAIIGDIPIFIAHDSADAWTHRDLFYINSDGSLEIQAGVPPDYFSETGQLWGNPLYRWDRMKQQGYSWWVARFQSIFSLVDMVRLDHFRGFEAYWAVPGDAPNAIEGEWRPGPGPDLFRTLREVLGPLPIIAEDLGVITPEVVALREEFDYPGMRILQFAFTGDTKSNFLPHNFEPNTVAYTGTHDNDTTRGWFDSLVGAERERALAYLDTSPSQVTRSMMRAIVASVADTVVAPMQDVLDLGTETRMNLPGRVGGYWQWRMTTDQLTDEDQQWLAQIATLYERIP